MIVDNRYIGQWRAVTQKKKLNRFSSGQLNSIYSKKPTAQALPYADALLIRVEEASREVSSSKPTACFIALESLNSQATWFFHLA